MLLLFGRIYYVCKLGQFCTKALWTRNLENVSNIIKEAAAAGAKMVFLPEASDFITNASEVMKLTRPLDQNEFVLGVRERARASGVWISVGVHESVGQVYYMQWISAVLTIPI
jgi:predicted amidohydrolase